MSSKNPFRQQDPPPKPAPRRPSPPPPSPSQPEASTSASLSDVMSQLALDEDPDDLPPPYTPAANAAMGEETVGLGPQRPFQPAPQVPPPSQRPPPGPQQYQNWSPAPTSNWHPPPQHPSSGLAPWQIQQQFRQRQNGGGGLIGALIGTVRDIADVVSGAHDERVIAVQRANAGAYAAPYASTGTMYAPPPGPPGQIPQPPPPPRAASTPPRSPSSTVPDDGTPTRTPVPGHPLLRDGNLLVYPRDHLCVKCKNTGYKNYDPSHPCRKCWEKYGKPYTGALTYTPWAPSGNDARMQRPLPKFMPPHMSSASQSQSPSRLQHSRSVSQPNYLHSPGSGPSYYVRDPLSPYLSPPPVPHAIPVSPGDPRLGGNLCGRCQGAGIRTFMLIDVTTCDTCGGTGRLWD